MSIVAETVEHVVGIDTHARTHTYCVVHARTGAVVDTATFPTSKPGNARAVDWIVRRCPGGLLAAVEGTSSYGAGITAALLDQGLDVVEVRPAARSSHAHAGKSDTIDAEAAARAVIGRDYATPRPAPPERPAGGPAGAVGLPVGHRPAAHCQPQCPHRAAARY